MTAYQSLEMLAERAKFARVGLQDILGWREVDSDRRMVRFGDIISTDADTYYRFVKEITKEKCEDIEVAVISGDEIRVYVLREELIMKVLQNKLPLSLDERRPICEGIDAIRRLESYVSE